MISNIVRKLLITLFSTEKPRGFYRPDIDGLRALAVFAVIVYHYSPKRFPAGFIGVDIFFVISGYLITGILAKAFNSKTFGAVILDFYQRRIKRIFPALILVLICSLVLGWLVLFASEYQVLGKHIAAGSGFVQNIVLWQESGYFDVDAIQKPLLHLWSLAVEEQFYIFWPLALWFVIRRQFSVLTVISIVFSISFALNIWSVYSGSAVASFYSPLTRAWELMLGAWLAVAHRNNIKIINKFTGLQSWLGLCMIIVGFILIKPYHAFPGLWAVLPVFGAALIINAGSSSETQAPILNRYVFSIKPAVWVGLISYPLYLWHWLLLSFAVISFGTSDLAFIRKVKLACLFLSFLLSYLTYRFFEQPVRKKGGSKAALVLLLIVAILGISGYGIYRNGGLHNRPITLINPKVEEILKTISRSQIAINCFKDKDLVRGVNQLDAGHKGYCILGNSQSARSIAVYGDSHAEMMADMWDEYGKENNIKIIFTFASGCLALVDIHNNRTGEQSINERCDKFGNDVPNVIKDLNVDAVVLIQSWNSYFTNDGIYVFDNKHKIYGQQAFKLALNRTIKYYNKIKVPVIIFEDNPHQKADPNLLIDRFNKDFVGRNSVLNSLSISMKEHQASQSGVNKALRNIIINNSFNSIFNLDSVFCKNNICPIFNDGRSIYYNSSHISIYGSSLLKSYLSIKINDFLNMEK